MFDLNRVYPDVWFVQWPWLDEVVNKVIPAPKPGERRPEIWEQRAALKKQLRLERRDEEQHLKNCGIKLKPHYMTEKEADAAIELVKNKTGVTLTKCLGSYL